MTPQATRNIRRALLGLVVIVAAAVAWSLRRPAPQPPASPPPVAGAGPGGMTLSEVVYRSFREGKEAFVVKARAKVGEDQREIELRGVEVSFPSKVRGQAGTSTVVAEECRYDPSGQRAAFRGNVRVLTADGAELKTESLLYRADRGLAETSDPAEFRRQGLSGRATGISYDHERQRIELKSEVSLKIASDAGPPLEIRSAAASLLSAERKVLFLGAVAASRGPESLRAERLTLHLNEELDAVDRALAQDDVELRTGGGGGSDLPGAAGIEGARGARRLRCRKLEMWFRPDGSLLGLTARPDAELEVEPGPGEAPERRLLKARRLEFGFDREGRLERLEGRVGVSFLGQPLPPAAGPPRTMRCQILKAVVDSGKGTLQTVSFAGGVEFAQGKRRATGARAVYDEGKSTLFLTGKPRLVDEEQGSELQAEAIDLGTKSGDVAARGAVSHVLRRRAGSTRGGLLARDAPVQLLARALDYEAETRTGRYREDAVLRSGRDEVAAPSIVLEDPGPGRRRLTASGGVVSVLHPRAEAKDGKPAVPTHVQAGEMVYEEAGNQVVYEQDVVLRQGDIVTKSPRATITLTPDGARMQKLVAGEPVEIRQGERRATGLRGTYTPDTETMVLVGEKVVLQEPNRQVEGRSLTFHVGADRVLVDGRDEIRTESVFRREPRRP